MTYPNRMHKKGLERAAWLFLHIQSPVILNSKETWEFTSVWMMTVLKTKIKDTWKVQSTVIHGTETKQCSLPAFIFCNGRFLYLNVSTSTGYSFIYHRHPFVLLPGICFCSCSYTMTQHETFFHLSYKRKTHLNSTAEEINKFSVIWDSCSVFSAGRCSIFIWESTRQ